MHFRATGSILYAVCILYAQVDGHPHVQDVPRHPVPAIAINSPKFDLVKYQAAPSPTPSPIQNQEFFQVYQPVLKPKNARCEVLLMEHQFAWSYGIPFVGNYTPPNCTFNRVIMNFTVASRGRQFDRLALMYLGDTEVWRTSTAEPTANGIFWTYVKDMTQYMYFWKSPQKIIFDLGNLVDDTYTGIWNTTLTATFFTAEEPPEPASLIVPISARKGASSEASVFMIPSQNATNSLSLPQNVNRAVFSVSACGQATEEFWWANVLESDIHSFEPVVGTLYGLSPFREVQVYIDGQLAGVQWPFPVIFTGGITPGLWRPIVGIDAFDLREHEIDITPWLPVLCDGKEHTFEIKVAGILEDGEGSGTLTSSVGNSWYVTGKIFLWLDSDPASVTTGRAPTILLPAPVISTSHILTQNSTTGVNETLEYTTNVSRSLSISSLITTQSGTRLSTWTQSLSVKNFGLYTQAGAVQQNNQTTTGTDLSTGEPYYKATYSYPLYALSTYFVKPDGFFTLDGAITYGNHLSISGTPVFPTGLQPSSLLSPTQKLGPFSGTSLSTTLHGTGHYLSGPGGSSGFGSTGQELSFKGLSSGGDKELYYRHVEAVNLTVVEDLEVLNGMSVSKALASATGQVKSLFGETSPKAALGRGPGEVKAQLVQGGL
ncbi:peptide N-acetyl-beta-D-glucosaminyl asparaginase amidase A-domain-containing protein [Bisporella sp. PMI_857]|nr:peptide N-acetyl-beta-D-glucosaminyl asparaginase amidase A-domain-containing protein [Bisporella sp. PMI_857]